MTRRRSVVARDLKPHTAGGSQQLRVAAQLYAPDNGSLVYLGVRATSRVESGVMMWSVMASIHGQYFTYEIIEKAV